AGDVLYTLGAGGTLFALDLASGKELWRSSLANEGGHPAALPTPYVHDGKVYGADIDSLFVFEAGRRKRCLGRYTFNDSVQGQPIVQDNFLYVATRRQLWALRTSDK